MKKYLSLLLVTFSLGCATWPVEAQPRLVSTNALQTFAWGAFSVNNLVVGSNFSMVSDTTVTLDGAVNINEATIGTLNTTSAIVTLVTSGSVETTTLKVGGDVSSTVTKIIRRATTLDFPLVATNSFTNLTITVTGSGTNGTVFFSQTVPADNIIYNAYISATNTVTIRANNMSLTAVDPAASSVNVTVFQP